MSQFCTVLHFLIQRICIYPQDAQKEVCDRGSVVQAFYFERNKALPIMDSTCVCKWSSSQNPLFVKGLFFFIIIIFIMFSFCLILLMHFSDYESLLLLSFFFFFFYLETCQEKKKKC